MGNILVYVCFLTPRDTLLSNQELKITFLHETFLIVLKYPTPARCSVVQPCRQSPHVAEGTCS